MTKNISSAQEAELQKVARLLSELSQSITIISQQVASSNLSSDALVPDTGWVFRENDYATLATWLLNDPVALKSKAKWASESWPAYADRLSKYVGWSVDHKAIRRALERKNGRN